MHQEFFVGSQVWVPLQLATTQGVKAERGGFSDEAGQVVQQPHGHRDPKVPCPIAASPYRNGATILRASGKNEPKSRVRSSKQGRAARFPALSRSSLLRASDSRAFFPNAVKTMPPCTTFSESSIAIWPTISCGFGLAISRRDFHSVLAWSISQISPEKLGTISSCGPSCIWRLASQVGTPAAVAREVLCCKRSHE